MLRTIEFITWLWRLYEWTLCFCSTIRVLFYWLSAKGLKFQISVRTIQREYKINNILKDL